jgi:oligopeptide/dipeptide ABC transporter ATP-binding protein
MKQILLDVRHLRTSFFHKAVELRAADDLSFHVREGECVAIIGESGSGKSVSAMSILRLIPNPPGMIVGGEILFEGSDVLRMDDAELRELRGGKIGMIFQEAGTALNPVMTVGKQIAEPLRNHEGLSGKAALARAIELLSAIDIPQPEQRIHHYPHEFSGGMQQRVMIAMAMACHPKLLIADEPTTALDVTIQAQVLEALNKLRTERSAALIIITHNLGLVARYADFVKIMYGGKFVEEGTPEDVFKRPLHPYTKGLIRAVPRLDLPKSHKLYAIPGEPPDMSKIPPDSCAFAPRCEGAQERCYHERPVSEDVGGGHFCACFYRNRTGEHVL